MEIVHTCPLGHTCEKIVGDHIERCMWLQKIVGTDQQGNEHDDWNCAITWQPILQIEVAGTNRGQTQAIESLRNETVKRQTKALELFNDRTIRNT